MIMPVVQIWEMWVFVCQRIMFVNMRMPFACRNGFIHMFVVVMPIGVLMEMDVLHFDMRMQMIMLQNVSHYHRLC